MLRVPQLGSPTVCLVGPGATGAPPVGPLARRWICGVDGQSLGVGGDADALGPQRQALNCRREGCCDTLGRGWLAAMAGSLSLGQPSTCCVPWGRSPRPSLSFLIGEVEGLLPTRVGAQGHPAPSHWWYCYSYKGRV